MSGRRSSCASVIKSYNKDVTFHEFYFPMLTPYVQIKELSLRQLILSAEALPCSVGPFVLGTVMSPHADVSISVVVQGYTKACLMVQRCE